MSDNATIVQHHEGFELDVSVSDGEHHYVQWHTESGLPGTDTFVIRDGKIVLETAFALTEQTRSGAKSPASQKQLVAGLTEFDRDVAMEHGLIRPHPGEETEWFARNKEALHGISGTGLQSGGLQLRRHTNALDVATDSLTALMSRCRFRGRWRTRASPTTDCVARTAPVSKRTP